MTRLDGNGFGRWEILFNITHTKSQELVCSFFHMGNIAVQPSLSHFHNIKINQI